MNQQSDSYFGSLPLQSAPQGLDRSDPHNIEAEMSVLAACLLNQEAIEEVATVLLPSNFYRISHQRIYSSMLDLYARHIPLDHISVADNLNAQGLLESVGGKSYLLSLADNTFALTNWKNHADIVKRASLLRDLIRASSKIATLAYDAPDNTSEIIDTSEKILLDVTEKRVSSRFLSMEELVSAAYEELSALCEQGNKLAGVPTGFKDLDGLLHGMRGGDLIIIAARPGVGKTSFALNLAVNAAARRTRVAFLSLEMSASQLIQRIICSEGRIDLSHVRSGNISEADWASMADVSARLSHLDMYIDDTPALSILELRAKARRVMHGADMGLVIVDYLQLMSPPQTRKDGNRAVEVGEISRGLKVLAKELNMPVIALSQLSRQVEMRGKKRPMLSDLRESGSIEQDADVVMFIDRSMDESEAEAEGRPELGTAELIVAKHRNGPTRDIKLAFLPDYTLFMDFVEGYENENTVYE